MKTRRIFSIFLTVILAIISFSADIFAADTIFLIAGRYDSYAYESSRILIGTGFEIFFDTQGDTERIGIEVSKYSKRTVEYKTAAGCIEYRYEGSAGPALSVSTLGQYAGNHYERLVAKRTQDSTTLIISIYLDSNSGYSLEEASGRDTAALNYTAAYQSYLDNLQLERGLADEKLMEVSSTSLFSEGFLNAVFSGDASGPAQPVLQAEYLLDEHIATLKITGLKLVDEDGNYLYETRYFGETKYLIKFDSSLGKVNVEQINTNDYMVKRISISTDQKTKKTTIVIESDGKLVFKRNADYDESGFELNISTRPIPEYTTQDPIEDPYDNADTGNSDLSGTGYTDNIFGAEMNALSVNYTNKISYDEVAVSLTNAASYTVHRMTEPERVVIDLKGINLTCALKTTGINSLYIEKIRYAHFDNNTARVVLDLKNPAGYSDSYSPQNAYTYEVRDGKLYIKVEKRMFEKFYYSNMGDRIYMLMVGEYLTTSEYDPGENALYSSSYDPAAGVYTISYDSVYNYNGRMNINDSSISYIEISTISGKAVMKVQLKDRNISPLPITRYMKTGTSLNYWHSTITFLKPRKAGEKLVVIDPGHGGADPGAVANGVNEKDLNLDIAKRLKDLFSGSNVRIYLTRSDDSYVGLGERTAAANAMNADLFLSIHNNAYYSSFNGTETFHYTYPQALGGIDGAAFAGILQKYLVDDLRLFDRGVKQNTFSVLKNSDMPSALVEIGFITNLSDVAKLRDPAFRQKAAIALYKALNESLIKMR